MSNEITLADVELPDQSVGLILTDLGDGSFSAAIVGMVQDVPKPILEMILGCKKLVHYDQKLVFEACYDDFGDEVGVADDIDWANYTGKVEN